VIVPLAAPVSRSLDAWLGELEPREAREPLDVWADRASLVVFALLSVVVIATLDDYGLTYDEEPHLRYGERVLEFYTGGFRASNLVRGSSYGAAFDLLSALVRRISPWDAYRTNHVLCALSAELGLLGTWRLGRLVAGPVGGLFGLLFLVLTPVYYGHQFNNPKDIPFAAGYVWGLYFIARLVMTASRAGRDTIARLGGRRFWVWLALALALGMCVRVGGAILIGYLVLFVVLVTLERWWLESRAAARELTPVWVGSLLSIAGAWLLLLASWPRVLLDPVHGPQSAIETVSKYKAYDSPTLLGGRTIPSQKVPWDYLPTYFAIQLPELTTVCFVLGVCLVVALAAWALARRRRQPWGWLLLVLAVLLPPAYAVVRGSTLYNGLRHFLFIIPPLAVLAGAFAALLLRAAARRGRVWRGLVLAVLGLFCADQAWALFRTHPHQHAYFNRASGGLAHAIDRYETEYYGAVYQELSERFVREVWETRRDEYLNRTFLVAGCGSNLFFKRNLPMNFQFTAMRNAGNADYYVTYARDGCLKRFRDRELVTSVQRDGGTLGVARDMKRRARAKAPAKAR
jgi:hypothetical protein